MVLLDSQVNPDGICSKIQKAENLSSLYSCISDLCMRVENCQFLTGTIPKTGQSPEHGLMLCSVQFKIFKHSNLFLSLSNYTASYHRLVVPLISFYNYSVLKLSQIKCD